MEIDDKEKIVVGVNKFESDSNEKQNLQEIDQKAVESQLERLKIFRNNRNSKSAEESLELLSQSINNDDNLIPSIIRCVESDVTLGELSNLLKSKFGEYQN